MARTARCTSCGAPVEFRSIASVLAVCDYCQSTLVRDGKELANLGRMAELIADRSPLQRGAEGKWHGLHFALIGRIQYRYDAGLWNEWHLLFDNGRSGWLSEAGGEYVLSMPRRVTEELPRFESVHVGDDLALDGTSYRVTNLLTAECIAGEGELPFKVGGGYTAPVVDLRSEAGGFATLDYSDNPERPLVFIGESVEFNSLGWSKLREALPLPTINVKARAFNCPSCAAPLEVKHEGILSVGCGSCGAVLDTANETVSLIARSTDKISQVPFPALGSKGELCGEQVEVIGYLARRGDSDGESFWWKEWVLLGADGKTFWLTNYDGHWNFGHVLQRALRDQNQKVKFDGTDFKHFVSYGSVVECVVGEFPWRVRISETAGVEDYIAPPRMLSHEITDNEETWTLLEYVEPTQIAQAFAPEREMAQPSGIYANQVNPHAATHSQVCRRFWKFLLTALAVQALLMAWGSTRVLLDQSLTFSHDDDEPQQTREFRLERRTGRLDIAHHTDLNNNWLSLNVTLINKDTGEAWRATRELSAYEGVDEGEHWSEGSRSDELTFTDLPPGTYVLSEDAELGIPEADGLSLLRFGNTAAPRPAAGPPVHAQVRIEQAGPRWSSFVIAMIWLALFPIYTRIRRYSFESKRWAESDHPHVYGSTSGDSTGSSYSPGSTYNDFDSFDSSDSGGDGGGDGGGGGD